MKRKYTTITFCLNNQPIKLKMVTRDFRSYFYWLQRNNYNWTSINVYDRYTGAYIMQLRPNTYWSKIEKL